MILEPAPGMAFHFGPVENRPTEGLEPFVFPTVPVPEPEGDDDARLLASIRVRGVTTPLVILADGRVVNGRARLRHAKTLGLPTVPTRQLLTLVTDLEAETFSAGLALAGRHLTPGQVFTMLHALSELQRERAEAVRRPRGRVTRTGRDLSIDAASRTLTPAAPAADARGLPTPPPETLDGEILKKLWELCVGFKNWPRPDRERLLEVLAEFRGRVTTAIEGRRGHEDGPA